MGKKIIISFSAQPTIGEAFDYAIETNGYPIFYPNGEDNVAFDYEAMGGTDPTKVQLGPFLDYTIDYTLAFLNANYSTPYIFYTRVDDTIEVSIVTDAPTTVVINSENPNIDIETEDVSNITTLNLKYFFKYTNIVKDEYVCEIYKKNYTGDAQEIHGTAIIEKATVTNHLDPIRGGGLSLKLEANKDLTLEDLYSESEQEYSVKLSKKGKVLFRGFLNPDGVYQDYVKDEWVITLDCVDGLGALSNLSFVQSSGLHFTGKMLAIDIIYNCLKRTGILMPINTSVNIIYDGLALGTNPFEKIYLNADRFVKVDDNTIMSCEDVLKSILDIFKACITQKDGEWYIYKPNEIYLQPYVLFQRFDINGVFKGTKTVNLNASLGSQIDGFYPHHCGSNQRIEIKGSVGGFRLGYKYGFVSGLLTNPKLEKNRIDILGHPVYILEYDGWTVFPEALINDQFKSVGFLFKNNVSALGSDIAVSDDLSVTINDDLSFKMDYEVSTKSANSFVRMRIKQGIYYLKYAPANQYTPIQDTINAVWTTDDGDIFTFALPGQTGSVTIQLPELTTGDDLVVSIINTTNTDFKSTTWIKSFDIIPTQNANPAEGEFHTVERTDRVSSIVKPNQTVYNGDNDSVVYSGTVFKQDAETPTSLWLRSVSADKFPLLRIAAEEELRISQRPTKIFRGDFYGYIPYLSLIEINNIGKFMPIEWSYDTMTNVTTCKQLELFVSEIPDIVYKYTLDYGETVKPTIK